MISEILGVVDQVIGMINANEAQGKYRQTLDELARHQGVPESARLAQEIYRSKASSGLAGKEKMEENILSMYPETMNEAKAWLTGPGASDYIARTSAAVNKQLRDLEVLDEQALERNIKQYAEFMGNTLGGYEERALDRSTNLQAMSANAAFAGANTSSDYLSGILGNIGSLGDSDWSKIIALLSKSKSTEDKPIIPLENQQTSSDTNVEDIINLNAFRQGPSKKDNPYSFFKID
jgi:hypothetical protein